MYLCDTKYVALMSQPLGFLRFPLKISLYNSMLLLLMASSNVIVIIIGTSFDGKSPGIVVPSSEQKQSGSTQTAGSHGGARLGSLSMSEEKREKNCQIRTLQFFKFLILHFTVYSSEYGCASVALVFIL